MQLLETTRIECPYCAESFEIVVDCSVAEQAYVEDCFVCCRPISINVLVNDDGLPSVSVSAEDE